MEKSELEAKIYSKIDELPTLPIVVPKLLSLTESSKSSASDITELISQDPALTSKILKVANSAYYGFSQKISELEMAVPLLGFNMVRSLALSIGVVHSLPKGKESQYFSSEGLWLHSLAVAIVIKELSKRYVKSGEKTEYYFVIGLLHDVGKIVLDQFFSEQFQEALKYANEGKKNNLHTAESELIGIEHCEVAAMLLTRWKFPEKIIGPIEFHHQRELPEGINAVNVAMLRIANIIVQELAVGREGNSTPNSVHEEDLQLLKLNEEKLDEMRSHSQGIIDDIHSFFSALS